MLDIITNSQYAIQKILMLYRRILIFSYFLLICFDESVLIMPSFITPFLTFKLCDICLHNTSSLNHRDVKIEKTNSHSLDVPHVGTKYII